MFARLRKWLLVYLLVLVAGGAWLSERRVTSWERTLWVAVYPINGDGSATSAAHIAALGSDAFDDVEAFVNEAAARHGVVLRRPIDVAIGPVVDAQPPAPPAEPGIVGVMAWSLRLRWWSWRVDKGARPLPADVTVYVRYFDPERSPRLAHSLGIRKGRIGVVNAFANRRQSGPNAVIVTHELLHTLGAQDRYDTASGQPVFPDGFAEPDAEPLYPQRLAEIMGGRIPLSPVESLIPDSLRGTVVGPRTAMEIGWREAPG